MSRSERHPYCPTPSNLLLDWRDLDSLLCAEKETSIGDSHSHSSKPFAFNPPLHNPVLFWTAVIENILLRPLPVSNPQQLMSLNWGGMVNVSYPNYIDFRDRNAAFSSLIAYRYNPVNLGLRARENFRVWGYEATGNYFGTLGIQPLLGRFFGPADDDKPGGHPVLVISYRFWQGRFGADPNVVGRVVRVNG